MIARALGLAGAIAAALLLVTLAVVNRHPVRLVLDPFDPGDPVLAIDAPFYFYLFAVLLVGVIAGGAATWISQGYWRRVARRRAQEAGHWRAEAERLGRERDAAAAARRQPAIAGR